MFVARNAMKRGIRGLTEMAPYHILKAAVRVHASCYINTFKAFKEGPLEEKTCTLVYLCMVYTVMELINIFVIKFRTLIKSIFRKQNMKHEKKVDTT